jgi:glycosyltransferase involved in cell wall biosynthesis
MVSFGQHESDPRADSRHPRVVIGVPLYNNAAFLSDAVDSLLAQTYRNFVLLLVDDASHDDSNAIAAAYAAREPRIAHFRHDHRVGMCANWRSCVSLAVESYPEASYFAWASDHDLWNRCWLERMVETLDRDPNAVLAYPFGMYIDERSEIVSDRWFRFDTTASDTRDRVRATFLGMRAGNMVYGLARLAVLARIGGLRDVIMPDRLLMYELALYGTFRQVPEVLWKRRDAGVAGAAVRERQERSLFVTPPLHTHMPYWWTHVAAIGWAYAVRGEGKPAIGRSLALGVTADVFLLHLEHECGRARKQLKHGRKAVQRPLRHARKRMVRIMRRGRRAARRRLRGYVGKPRIVGRVRRGALEESMRANTQSRPSGSPGPRRYSRFRIFSSSAYSLFACRDAGLKRPASQSAVSL